MAGWLNAWREGGWVPQWSSPGYRGSMTGTMSDVSMSEAIVKLPHCGSARAAAAGYCVDAAALYNASRQNAFVPPVGTQEGRQCLLEYAALGYVAVDGACDATVSRTMNYWHADWAIAQAALVLGEAADAATLLARAARWPILLNNATGFFAPKNLAGAFLSDFDEFAWGPGPGYTEAGPWQYRVEVPYAPRDLAAALAAAGYDGCDIIQAANTMPSTVHAGGYGNIIHEQAEMGANCWGQWVRGCRGIAAHSPLRPLARPRPQHDTLAAPLTRPPFPATRS
jgi:putative alpha-1,2-mannosidase